MSTLSEIHAFPKLDTINHWKSWKETNAHKYPTIEPLLELIQDKTTHVGIEVEVENMQRGVRIDDVFWSIKEDNSLRNNGLEFVSWVLVGNQIPYAVLNLMQALPNEASFSQRTSVHIHVNVRDLTPDDLAKLLLVYLTIERLLYRFVGANRDKNIFCVPLHELGMPEKLFTSLKQIGREPLYQTENTRYSGLNFDPCLKFGSVEFRQLHGTRDPVRLLTWINLLLCIRKFAIATEMTALIAEILALNTTSAYKHYAQKIFGDLLMLFPAETLNTDMELGVVSVKRSMFSNKFKKELSLAAHPESNARQYIVENYTRHLVAPKRPIEQRFFQPLTAAGGVINVAPVLARRRPGHNAFDDILQVGQNR